MVPLQMGDRLEEDGAQTEVDREVRIVDEVAAPAVRPCGGLLKHVLGRDAPPQDGVQMTFREPQQPLAVFLERLCQEIVLSFRLHAGSSIAHYFSSGR